MKQEDKQLLLQDICARLPYGVKVWYKYDYNGIEKFATSIRLVDNKLALSSKLNKEGDWYYIEEAGEILIKPYLFPLSSMTEEQKEEFDKLYVYDALIIEPQWELIDFCNKHHLDYRGLIPMGLAIDATNLNIY